MDYNLARKLKESGFPQKENVGIIELGLEHFNKEKVYFPTLEELIEGCGEGFRGLILHSERSLVNGKSHLRSRKWQAKAGKSAGGFLKDGKTPLEAVGHLYLALKRRNEI